MEYNFFTNWLSFPLPDQQHQNIDI